MLVALAFDGLGTEQKNRLLENRIQICMLAPNERTVAASTNGGRKNEKRSGTDCRFTEFTPPIAALSRASREERQRSDSSLSTSRQG